MITIDELEQVSLRTRLLELQSYLIKWIPLSKIGFIQFQKNYLRASGYPYGSLLLP